MSHPVLNIDLGCFKNSVLGRVIGPRREKIIGMEITQSRPSLF